MKTLLSPFASSAALCAALSFATAAQASGVVAGTQIQNTASASYSTGTATTTVQSNTVTVNVDELLDTAVASLDSAPQPAASNPAVLSFSITNPGNGSEAFRLTTDTAIPGNSFDATVQSIVVDSNGNGVYDPGIDTVVTPGGLTPLIAPDGTLTVFVLASLSPTAIDGQTSQLRLTATAATGFGTPGTTFAGQGDSGVDAVVGATTAQTSALGSIVAQIGAVTLQKSAVIADPFGGTQPVPGAVVTYSIKADVAGSGSVQNLHVLDVIPAGTTYQAGTLKLDGSALSDATDADAGSASAAGIDVTLGTVGGGSSHTVTFEAKIN